MSEEKTTGITIKELKAFLDGQPKEFDDFGLVNGEVIGLDEYYVRVDKPIIHLEIDETTKEFMLLHQSEKELEEILKDIEKYGTSEGTKE
jgi:hypothetical protein